MNNVTYVTDTSGVEHAIIDHGDGSFTSMTKAHYEAQQVEHLTENVTITEPLTEQTQEGAE